MNTFALEIIHETEKVTFYSVRWDDSEISEFEKFLDKLEKEKTSKRYKQEFLSLLFYVIGKLYGAVTMFFSRFEEKVVALPPNKNLSIFSMDKGNPYRLYCLRLSDSIVILFNGGHKTSREAKGNKGTSMVFSEANIFAKRINESIVDKTIIVDNNKKRIFLYNGSEDIIL